ncbi:MAG: hypothetical protein M3R17_00550 [Bacteroidota bacterium]|nr:hypothetical protein [Bacteroidota bacterium]
MKWRLSALLFSLLCSASLFSQDLNTQKAKSRSDTVITPCFALSFSYALQLPGGDLVHRFGANSSVGIGLNYKTRKNFIYGAQWTYLFGKDLRGENPIDSITTTEGFIIDKEGKFADIRMFERGFTLGLSAGKIFNTFLSPNINSGFTVTAGVGYLQHKIKIYDNGARSPQFDKETLKGYDRLTSGIMTTEFVGYYYLSKSRYVNFYCGLEFYQGFTKSRRSWDYSLMRADTENRIDLLSGFRVGWVLPLYKTSTRTKYYY